MSSLTTALRGWSSLEHRLPRGCRGTWAQTQGVCWDDLVCVSLVVALLTCGLDTFAGHQGVFFLFSGLFSAFFCRDAAVWIQKALRSIFAVPSTVNLTTRTVWNLFFPCWQNFEHIWHERIRHLDTLLGLGCNESYLLSGGRFYVAAGYSFLGFSAGDYC